MEFSEKEQQVLDLIKEADGVTVKDIKERLGEKAVGGIGKLIQADIVETKKVKMGDGYGMKLKKVYVLKENKNES